MALLPPERHAPAGTPRPPAPRIVVVGDAPVRTPLVAHALGAAGFGVRRVGSGAEALWSALRAGPDLVVLDLELPDGQGLALLGRLRARSRVPVILLGAPHYAHSPIAVAQALDQGGDDYLTHPVDPDELAARVRAVLRRAPGGLPTPLRCAGGLEIDLTRRRVTRRGQRIALTASEWRLLGQLATHAGQVMLAGELLTSVWGPAYRDELAVLRVGISRLRRELGAPGEPGPIRTYPGIGYALHASAGGAWPT